MGLNKLRDVVYNVVGGCEYFLECHEQLAIIDCVLVYIFFLGFQDMCF